MIAWNSLAHFMASYSVHKTFPRPLFPQPLVVDAHPPPHKKDCLVLNKVNTYSFYGVLN